MTTTDWDRETEQMKRNRKLLGQLERATKSRQFDGWTAREVMDSFVSAQYRWGLALGYPTIYVNDDATGFKVCHYDLHGQHLREPEERKTVASAMKLAERWANEEVKS